MERWNGLPYVPQLVNSKSNTKLITNICIILLLTMYFDLLVLTTNPKDSLSECYHYSHSTEWKTEVHRRKVISLHLHVSKGAAPRVEAVTCDFPELVQCAAHRPWLFKQHPLGDGYSTGCVNEANCPARMTWPGCQGDRTVKVMSVSGWSLDNCVAHLKKQKPQGWRGR